MEKEQQERKYGRADRGEGAVEWTGAKPRNLGPENHDQKGENKDQEEGQYQDEEDQDEEEEEEGGYSLAAQRE